MEDTKIIYCKPSKVAVNVQDVFSYEIDTYDELNDLETFAEYHDKFFITLQSTEDKAYDELVYGIYDTELDAEVALDLLLINIYTSEQIIH